MDPTAPNVNPMGDPDATRDLTAVAGPFWTEEKVRKGVLSVRSWAILAVTTADGDRIYPAWQFRRATGGYEVWPDLIRAFWALRRHDPWAVAVILRTPAPELDGVTPVEWVRAGRPTEALLRFAEIVAREWGHT